TELNGTEGNFTVSTILRELPSGRVLWDTVYAQLSMGRVQGFAPELLTHVEGVMGVVSQSSAGDTQVQMFPTDVQRWLDRGHYHYQAGNYSLAREMYDSAQARSPDNLVIHYWIGTALAAQEEYDEAIRHYQLALPDAPASELFLWDTTVRVPETAKNSAYISRSGRPAIVAWEDSVRNEYVVACMDPVNHRVHRSGHPVVGGFPVVYPNRITTSQPQLSGQDWSHKDRIESVRIITPDGRTLGTLDRRFPPPHSRSPLRLNAKWHGDLLTIRYSTPNAHTGVSRTDSVCVFSKSGEYEFTLSVGSQNYEIIRVSHFVCVAINSHLRIYDTDNWQLVDNVELGFTPGDWITDGAIVLLSKDSLITYDPHTRSTNRFTLPQHADWTVEDLDIANCLLIRSPRHFVLLTRENQDGEYHLAAIDSTGGEFVFANDGMWLWVLSSDGRVSVRNLNTGREAARHLNGPQWQPGTRGCSIDAFPTGVLFSDRSSLTFYSRGDFDVLWRRTLAAESSVEALPGANLIWVESRGGSVGGTAMLLRAATGRDVVRHQLDWGVLADRLGYPDRLFAVRGGVSGKRFDTHIGEFNLSYSNRSPERWEIALALGRAQVMSGHPVSAIRLLSESVHDHGIRSLESLNTLRDAYNQIGRVDSALLLAYSASTLTTDTDVGHAVISDYLWDELGGRVLLRPHPIATRGVLRHDGQHLEFRLDQHFGPPGDPPLIGSIEDRPCFQLVADGTSRFDIAGIGDGDSIIAVASAPFLEDTCSISQSPVTVKAIDALTCSLNWALEFEGHCVNDENMIPILQGPDRGYIIIGIPHVWDSILVDTISLRIKLRELMLYKVDLRTGTIVDSIYQSTAAAIDVLRRTMRLSDYHIYREFEIKSVVSSSEHIVIAEDSVLHCVSWQTGKTIWRVELGFWLRSVQLLNPSVAIASGYNRSVCLNVQSGEPIWDSPADRINEQVVSETTIAAVHGDTVELYDLNPKGMRIENPRPQKFDSAIRHPGYKVKKSVNYVLIEANEHHSRWSSDHQLILFDQSTGRRLGQFTFRIPLVDHDLDSTHWYGLLSNGMIISARLDKLFSLN
ncbi:MAG: tetratricopeptide repeat protein, partial [candidate division Zixibacteria bacterium]|nr:tetratricopeptide repeat protein [candidate division Zixibacteria bacterium]